MQERSLVDNIFDLELELRELKKKKDVAKEALEDEIINTIAYPKLQKALEEVQNIREQLKLETQNSRDIVKIREDIGELNAQERDLKDILSAHLVRFKLENDNADQVPLPSDNRKARHLVINAHLGKEEYFQERMQLTGGSAK
jgi:hypothetical protein